MGQRTTLYRFYDGAGRLLYVGITMRLPVRFEEHEKQQPWWHDAVGATFEHFPDRAAAERAEAPAIHLEQPLHNVVGTPRGSIVARTGPDGLPRGRMDCPLCGWNVSIMCNGLLHWHNAALHNDHGCTTYYGRCPASGQRSDVPLPAGVRERASRLERVCEHDRDAPIGSR
jgi:hypothetical protein